MMEKEAEQLITKKKIPCPLHKADAHEVEMGMKVIALDLPHHIGFLSIITLSLGCYNFTLTVLAILTKDFQYCEIDTDSAYLLSVGRVWMR